jgi:hypothetical protein
MELSPLTIIGTRPVRGEAASSGNGGGGKSDLRAAYLSRLPSVEPGSLSSAYRSFRAEEAMAALPQNSAGPSAAPAAATAPSILSGSIPAALAAYRDAASDT